MHVICAFIKYIFSVCLTKWEVRLLQWLPKLLAVFIHLLQYLMNIILHACIVLDNKIGKDDRMQLEQMRISCMYMHV